MRNAPLAVTALLWAAAAAMAAAQTGGSTPARAAGPAPAAAAAAPAPAAHRALVDQYCVTCHNARVKTGGLALDGLDLARLPELSLIHI